MAKNPENQQNIPGHPHLHEINEQNNNLNTIQAAEPEIMNIEENTGQAVLQPQTQLQNLLQLNSNNSSINSLHIRDNFSPKNSRKTNLPKLESLNSTSDTASEITLTPSSETLALQVSSPREKITRFGIDELEKKDQKIRLLELQIEALSALVDNNNISKERRQNRDSETQNLLHQIRNGNERATNSSKVRGLINISNILKSVIKNLRKHDFD